MNNSNKDITLSTVLDAVLDVKREVADVKKEVRQNREAIENLEDKVDNLELKVDSLEAKVDNLELKANSLEAKVDRNKQSIDDVVQLFLKATEETDKARDLEHREMNRRLDTLELAIAS